GTTWSDIGTGLSFPLNSLAADPLNPQNVLAGVTDKGVYKLTDGLIWSDFKNGSNDGWTDSTGSFFSFGDHLLGSTISKAKAFSPAFNPCSVCTIESDVRIDAHMSATIYGWYQNSKNYISLTLNEDTNKITLSRKKNGKVAWKKSESFDVAPGGIYHLR